MDELGQSMEVGRRSRTACSSSYTIHSSLGFQRGHVTGFSRRPARRSTKDLIRTRKARSTHRLAQSVMKTLTEIGSTTVSNEGWKVACEGVGARACVIAGGLEDSEEGS